MPPKPKAILKLERKLGSKENLDDRKSDSNHELGPVQLLTQIYGLYKEQADFQELADRLRPNFSNKQEFEHLVQATLTLLGEGPDSKIIAQVIERAWPTNSLLLSVPQVAKGVSDFRKIREKGSYYVDKTGLISEILANKDAVLLLPRPRRFGKTLNMSMLHNFFDIRLKSAPLFKDLAVSNDPKAMKDLNAYPTLFITFRTIDSATWEGCQDQLKLLISKILEDMLPIVALDKLLPANRERLLSALNQKATIEELSSILALLVDALHRSTNKEVVLLIDEYDNPIHKGYEYGYYEDVTHFMRSFLASALKDNPLVERAVVTGILRVAKESIFSGLNNLTVCSILSDRFSQHFGFTMGEVHNLLKDFKLTDVETEVRAFYNGYRFGSETITNPWSILSYVQVPKDGFVDYWLGTSSNSPIKDLIKNRNSISIEELELLLRGESVSCPIEIPVALTDFTPQTVWSLLLFSGYLTTKSGIKEQNRADLVIPNQEVRRFFEQSVRSWLSPLSGTSHLLSSLIDLNFVKFARLLQEILETTFSYHDMNAKLPEQPYHVFMVTLLVAVDGRYKVNSNREEGHGRYDVVLEPKKPDLPAFVFEFKQSSANALEKAADEALAQIDARNYTASLRKNGAPKIAKIGLAFAGKRIAMAACMASTATQAVTEVQYYPERQTAATSVVDDAGAPKSSLGFHPIGAATFAKDSNTKPEDLQSENEETRTQKAVLVGKIQLLQEIKNQTVLSKEHLVGLTIRDLEDLLKALLTDV